MNSTLGTLLAITGFACAIRAQVPAPDFQIDVTNLQLNSFDVGFQVQGPPNMPVAVTFTLSNPYTTPQNQLLVFPFFTGVFDPSGHLTMPLGTVPWQGPLPEIWFQAVIFRPNQQPVVCVAEAGGSTAFWAAPNSANINTLNTATRELEAKVKIAGGPCSVSVWTVPCGLLPPYPSVGSPFTLSNQGTYEGGGVTDNRGDLTWTGTVSPTGCVVVVANGVILGVLRR